MQAKIKYDPNTEKSYIETTVWKREIFYKTEDVVNFLNNIQEADTAKVVCATDCGDNAFVVFYKEIEEKPIDEQVQKTEKENI